MSVIEELKLEITADASKGSAGLSAFEKEAQKTAKEEERAFVESVRRQQKAREDGARLAASLRRDQEREAKRVAREEEQAFVGALKREQQARTAAARLATQLYRDEERAKAAEAKAFERAEREKTRTAQREARERERIQEEYWRRLAARHEAENRRYVAAERRQAALSAANLRGGGGFGSGFAGAALPGAGIFGAGSSAALGAAIGGAAVGAGYAAYRYLDEGIDLSRDRTRADLFLRSASRRSGTSYAANARFAAGLGDEIGLGMTLAETVTAQATRVTNMAGLNGKAPQFVRALADAATAAGRPLAELGDMMTQVATGQDEVFDKLLSVNPETLYKRWADAAGRTTGSLTDLEKLQIRINAVIEAGNDNLGEAARRLDTAAGKWENFQRKLQDWKTQVGEDFLTLITGSEPTAEQWDRRVDSAAGPAGDILRRQRDERRRYEADAERAQRISAEQTRARDLIDSARVRAAAGYGRVPAFGPGGARYSLPVDLRGAGQQVDDWIAGQTPLDATQQAAFRSRQEQEFAALQQRTRATLRFGAESAYLQQSNRRFATRGYDDPYEGIRARYRAAREDLGTTDPDQREALNQREALELERKRLEIQKEMNLELGRLKALGNPLAEIARSTREELKQIDERYGDTANPEQLAEMKRLAAAEGQRRLDIAARGQRDALGMPAAQAIIGAASQGTYRENPLASMLFESAINTQRYAEQLRDSALPEATKRNLLQQFGQAEQQRVERAAGQQAFTRRAENRQTENVINALQGKTQPGPDIGVDEQLFLDALGLDASRSYIGFKGPGDQKAAKANLAAALRAKNLTEEDLVGLPYWMRQEGIADLRAFQAEGDPVAAQQAVAAAMNTLSSTLTSLMSTVTGTDTKTPPKEGSMLDVLTKLQTEGLTVKDAQMKLVIEYLNGVLTATTPVRDASFPLTPAR